MSNKYPGGFISLGGQTPSNSVLFNGSNQYLSIPDNAGLEVGSSDFTVEAWIYMTAGVAANGAVVLSKSNTGSYGPFALTVSSTSYLQLVASTNGSSWGLNLLDATQTIQLGTWYHVAATRSGNNFYMFKNGFLVSSGTLSGALVNNTEAMQIGYINYPSTYFPGFLSNVRLVIGTALYTSNFAPPTSSLKNVTNTVLLTCQSPTIVDNSTANGGSGWTVTNNNSAVVSTQTPFQSYNPNNLDPALGAATPGVWTISQALNAEVIRSWPMYDPYYKNVVLNLHGNSGAGNTFITDASSNAFAITSYGNPVASTKTPLANSVNFPNGSGYLNGTSSFLDISTNAAFGMGTGDFTIECWVYPTSAWAAGYYNPIVFVSGTGLYFGQNNAGFGLRQSATSNIISYGTSPTLNTWTHVAVVRSGTTVTMYYNGTSVATATSSADFSAGSLRVGYDGSYYVPSMYLSNLRIVKGTAVYTTSFTPSTAPLTAISGTSLLIFQTPNPRDNNGFVDSSSNDFPITRNGNTTQGTFSPYGQGWSTYFNGAVYMQATITSAAILNGNSTIELWVYASAFSGAQTFIRGGNFNFGTDSTTPTKLRIDDGANGGSIYTSTGTMVANTWNYIALVRSGNNFSFYINGVLDSTNSSVYGFYTTNTTYIAAGAFTSGGTNVYTGYQSNLRVSTVARTISGTPTSPLTSDANTVLLTFQSNRFVDNSPNGYTFNSISGSPSVQRFSPFLFPTSYTPSTIGGSGYFDGTGDYLTTPSNAAFGFGTGDFTAELWFYPLSLTGALLYDPRTANTDNPSIGWGVTTSGKFQVTTNSVVITSTSTYTVGQWYHVAITRSSTTVTLWVNGVSQGTASNSTNLPATSVFIGNYFSVGYPANGYITDLRVNKGTAIYTGAFTPPSLAPLATSGASSVACYPSTTNVNTSFSSSTTSLLTSMTNAGIVDNAMMNDLETAGNAQISTSVKKYGTGSMYFDGTGDYLVGSSSPTYSFTGNVTIECWIYASVLNGSGSTAYGICGTHSGFNDNKTAFYVYGTGKIGVGKVGTNEIASATGVITTNNWYHVAAVRNGSKTTIYVNGISVASGTTDVWSTSASSIYVGYLNPSNGVNWNGYIDDLRITQGVARYISNFTPPTSQMQDQ